VGAEPLLAAALRGESVCWPQGAGAAFESEVAEAAHRHGVTALLAAAATLPGWPDALQLAFQQARRLAAATEAVQRQDLIRLLAAFGEAGERCLPLKGAQLAYTHYREPWLRPRFDTDLLVEVGRQRRADAVLRDLGYLPSVQVSGALIGHQLQYQRRNDFGLMDVVDLHWKVANPHVFADTLTFDELIAAAGPLPKLGEHARSLSNVHALILACVHRVAHHQNSDLLIWLYDIRLLAAAMTQQEQAEFLEQARARRLRSICASGFAAAERQLGGEGLRDVLDGLRSGEGDAADPGAAFLRQDFRRIDILLSDLRAVRGWTRKVRLIREHLFPPPAFIRARYGSRTPLVLGYVDRILGGIGKWFRAPS
jgi:hypothetical protein